MWFLTCLLRKTSEKDSVGSHHLHRREGLCWMGKFAPASWVLCSFTLWHFLAVCRLQFVFGFPPRPANSAVVSLAFGRYMLEPFFAPCAIPVPAVKLVSLLGYCKYWLLWDCRSPSLSALDQGHLWGVIFWDNCGIGAPAYLLGHPKLPNTRFWFGDQLEPYVGGVVPRIRVEILHVQLCKCHLVWGCKGQDFELLTWYTQPMKLSCLLQTTVYWHRDRCVLA